MSEGTFFLLPGVLFFKMTFPNSSIWETWQHSLQGSTGTSCDQHLVWFSVTLQVTPGEQLRPCPPDRISTTKWTYDLQQVSLPLIICTFLWQLCPYQKYQDLCMSREPHLSSQFLRSSLGLSALEVRAAFCVCYFRTT